MVIDEVAVPSLYWEPREPRLNRQGLVADLTPVAKELWEQTRQKSAAISDTHQSNDVANMPTKN
jgi:hypothetical protein